MMKKRISSMSRFRAGGTFFILAVWLTPGNVSYAQQFVTDDAAIVELNGCQIEAWHGRGASWVMPACSFIRELEFTAAIGFIAGDNRRDLKYNLEAKYLFRSVERVAFGFGIMAGAGLTPYAQTTGERIESIYAMIPLSLSLFAERLVVHQNTGWAYEIVDAVAGRDHVIAWGIRTDVTLRERIIAIAELFGEGKKPPEFQAGLRVTLVPERLDLDLSFGGDFNRDMRGIGPVVGLAWTPGPLF